MRLKGLVHPKMKILSLFSLLTFMLFQTHKTFIYLQNTNKSFLMKSESFLSLH